MAYVCTKHASKHVVAITIGAGIIGGTSAALCEKKAIGGKEGTESTNEDDIYVDITNLQTWDSNWDGRCLSFSLLDIPIMF